MKINQSLVVMQSERSYSSFEHEESVMYSGRANENVKDGTVKNLSVYSGKNAVAETKALVEEQKKANEADKKQAADSRALSYIELMRQRRAAGNSQFDVQTDPDGKIKMLRKLLAMLNGKDKVTFDDLENAKKTGVLDMRSSGFRMSESMSQATSMNLFSAAFSNVIPVGTTVQGTMMQKTSATSYFFAEEETTSFSTTGIAMTSDGRSLSFNVDIEMSRSFAMKYDEISTQSYIYTDPLIINLDSNVASVTDFKIGFDIDSDGKEEQVSFAGEGSGFLALDKNGDGKINNGSELFGTKSGDGFKDLAAYDEDGNGWIDENDSVFNNLKIWTKDKDGNDVLSNLKEMNVGAIYLGNVGTQFSLNDEANVTNAVIRRTGIYLKESGEAGTVNHVDLTR